MTNVVDITVAIATRDRPQLLARCLESLISGDAAPTEIVVADQSENHETEAVVKGVSTTTRLRYVRARSGGLGVAQNDAVRASRSPVVAVLDDDCVADRGWLTTIDRVLRERPDLVLLTGRVLPLGPAKSGLVAVSSRTSNESAEFSHPCLPWHVGSGNNFTVRRDAFLLVGGNDERLGPGSPGKGGVDMDLFYRLIRAGGIARYEPRALVLHERVSPAQRRARRIPYGYGMGASATILRREGDPDAPRLLRRWLSFRTAIALRAAAHLRHAQVREELLVLAGTLSGITYGRRVTKPMRHV